MKLTLQVQLLPDHDASTKLRATIERFNEAATWLATQARASGITSKFTLQHMHYKALRARFCLPAQLAIRCIAQVCDVYKRDRLKTPVFREHAAVPFDQRIMSFKDTNSVSLTTLDGRVSAPIVMGAQQARYFTMDKGQADLCLRRDGKWFLLVTVEVPQEPAFEARENLGVDLGVVNIAADSDGAIYTGAAIEATRLHYANRRTDLQCAAAGRKRRGHRPRSIRRALMRTSGREARFRRNTNHCISKALVGKAKGTGRGLVMEDLTHIRERQRFRRPQRARMSGWSFFQLRSFCEYKSKLAGVPFSIIDPRNTSRTCPECGHCEKGNRKNQAEFKCRRCGFEQHADVVGARNVRARAFVMTPMVSGECVNHGSVRVSRPQEQAAAL